jgi:hypothetical protein
VQFGLSKHDQINCIRHDRAHELVNSPKVRKETLFEYCEAYIDPQAHIPVAMASISSTYLIPAVLLNPVVILHGFNTFCSHFISITLPSTTSNHQWLQNLGPASAPGPYFDVHNNDQLCWGYTLLMVVVQILAYGKVNDTRVRKKSARAAAKAERERKAAQKDQKLVSGLCTSGKMDGHISESDKLQDATLSPHTKNAMNGYSAAPHDECTAPGSKVDLQNIEDSTTEPSSEEEMIV